MKFFNNSKREMFLIGTLTGIILTILAILFGNFLGNL